MLYWEVFAASRYTGMDVTPGIEVITKLDVAHQAPKYLSHCWPLCLRLYNWNYGVNIAGLFRTNQNRHSLWSEVQIRVAIMHEFACYNSHKADDDFLCRYKGLVWRTRLRALRPKLGYVTWRAALSVYKLASSSTPSLFSLIFSLIYTLVVSSSCRLVFAVTLIIIRIIFRLLLFTINENKEGIIKTVDN